MVNFSSINLWTLLFFKIKQLKHKVKKMMWFRFVKIVCDRKRNLKINKMLEKAMLSCSVEHWLLYAIDQVQITVCVLFELVEAPVTLWTCTAMSRVY